MIQLQFKWKIKELHKYNEMVILRLKYNIKKKMKMNGNHNILMEIKINIK